MSTTFPTTIDSYTHPNPNDPRSGSTSLSTFHGNLQDAITALETKVGINSSSDNTSQDYKLSGVTTGDKAVSKTGTETLTNKTLTAPKINIGSDATGDMYYRDSGGLFQRLAAGADGTIISYSGGLPTAIPNPSASNASTSVKGVVQEATTAQINAGTATGSTGAILVVTPDQLLASQYVKAKFGGTGADGALTITSGTTTIDLGSAAVVIKNYTSISITGTAVLTFINPNTNGTLITLKSQGAITLTSSATPMIDASGMGGASGTGSTNANGSAGSDGTIAIQTSSAGGGGTSTSATAGSIKTTSINSIKGNISLKYPYLFAGGGGGGGYSGGGTATGGNGGFGGGALVIECAGALNFTTSNGISVAGKNGANSTGSGFSAGGGGGGGGGSCCILYNTLTSSSGTINITAGSGGTGNTAGGGGGGAGATVGFANSTSTGGGGSAGISFVGVNTEFL